MTLAYIYNVSFIMRGSVVIVTVEGGPGDSEDAIIEAAAKRAWNEDGLDVGTQTPAEVERVS